MKKYIDLDMFKKYRFSIRKLYEGGKVTFLPMVREPGLFPSWRPIVKVYDEYVVMDYEKPGGLTQGECQEHVERFYCALKHKLKRDHLSIEYIEISTDEVSPPVFNEEKIDEDFLKKW